jgi:hypothetical protein
MKTKSIYIMALAGLVMAACNPLTGPDTGTGSGETIPPGMGLAHIRLGGDEGRTAVPDAGAYYYTLDFTAPGKTGVHEILNGGTSITVALEPAGWTVEVTGYADSAKTVRKVRGNALFSITSGTAARLEVYLTPDFSSGVEGSLAYSIGIPAAVSRAFLSLDPLDAPGTSREIDISSGAGGTASGILTDVPEGAYLAAIDLYDGGNNRAAVWAGAVHISGGSVTSLIRGFAAGDFAECDPKVPAGTNTLAAKLDAALGSLSGAYTIALTGNETDLSSFTPKTLNVSGSKNITITIRGNGHEVQLGGAGSLFTLGAASGSSLTLVLQDVTLRGISGNNDSLVRVNDRGTLETRAGSLITDNTSSYGGGVYVAGSGTFTMSGGAVSGNTSSSGDGGGGGVYVGGSGTFTMSGGVVSGNSTSYIGCGVYVGGRGASFTRSGGAVSGD